MAEAARLEAKRAGEKEVVSLMISLYCRKRHHEKGGLCPECGALNDYVSRRIDCCPHMETKTFCSRCGTPCYRPDMREQIRAVMRFSGPRMVLYHPIMALRHLASSMPGKKPPAV